MRQFKLINADNEEFNLMSKETFLTDVSGLGIGQEIETQRIGNTFIKIKEQEQQPLPSGTIIFNGYKKFDDFKSFIRKGKILFAYKPINTWYFLKCSVVIEKSEIDNKGLTLSCPIQFNGLSPWHEKLIVYRSETDFSKGKTYPYRYTYTYANSLPGVIDINNGDLPSFCKIHIMGPCRNPNFTLAQKNKRVSTGKINCRIEKDRKIILNSNPSEMEIAEYTVDGDYITDRYADSDFTTERLVILPPGNSRFSFTNDDFGDIVAWVEVEKCV